VDERTFAPRFTISIAFASIVFAATNFIQFLWRSQIPTGGLAEFQRGWLLGLALFASVEGFVCFVLGWFVAIVPARLVLRMTKSPGRPAFLTFIAGSAVFGLMLTPLFAGAAFWSTHDPDSPSYLARCLEFLMPTVTAGATGGALFWRLCLSPRRERKVLNEFS
jgi:hypothetical protein